MTRSVLNTITHRSAQCSAMLGATVISALFLACDGRPGDEAPDIPEANVTAAQQLDELDELLRSGAFTDAERQANVLHQSGMRHPRLAYIVADWLNARAILPRLKPPLKRQLPMRRVSSNPKPH